MINPLSLAPQKSGPPFFSYANPGNQGRAGGPYPGRWLQAMIHLMRRGTPPGGPSS